ncbi:molybdenum ABC transporter permease subunit [Bowdeniella nasicola]|uniref:Molybdenum ABC transporter permease subunit n=1 Tax=Bowdeniella nasicola TaxID=208480 RepID=A0A1Q5Q1R3_9ACTO|nr:ABC transporter permease [Bowdeniella nasicola]OKL53788.1 molybdenum ABC transporter permease subunit [Bowdeniella nasicola]
MPENLRRGTVPSWVYLLAVVGLAALVVPLLGLGTRVPWTRIPEIMGESDARSALWLSLKTCLASTAFAVVLGIPTSILLSGRWRGVKVARVLVLLPMALPPVVAGLALLQTFGRRGLIGSWLDSIGIQIGFTTTAVIMAQTFVSMPFLIVALQGALQVREQGHESIAATLGAKPTRILSRVTLPLVAPAIAQGTALALARSLGEFGATLTFAGSLTGVTRTMPLEIYLQRETDPDIALALAAVLIGVAICVVAVTAWQQGSAKRTPVADDADAEPATAESPDELPRSGTMGAPISAHIRVPERGVDVPLEVAAGDVVALLGRNGSGKSTCVQVMSGLLDGPGSTVKVGDRTLDSGSQHVPTRERGIALLAQRPLLLPHLSAEDNVAFGLRSRGIAADEARRRARAELAAVGCAHLTDRRPWQLSGGQAARVSLARALATDPDVIFLDEPMAALDVDAAADIRGLLARRFAATKPTVVLVTHNLLDVASLATHAIVLGDGEVIESGPAHEILTYPRTEFTAALAGMNMLIGRAHADPEDPHVLTIADAPYAITGVAASAEDAAELAAGPAIALFAPSAVSLYPAGQRPAGSPRNVLSTRVVSVEQAGRLARVAAEVLPARSGAKTWTISADVTLASVRTMGLEPGVELTATIKAVEVSLTTTAQRMDTHETARP